MRLLHSTDLSCSTKVSVLPDNLLSTEALLSQGETEILHLCSSLCCSDLVQFIKASREGGRRTKKLYSCSHGPNIKEKKTTLFLTMTAADVNLGRSSADLQEIAAATAVLGSLRTLKCMQDVLGLHKIINYISLLTFIQS